jgi:hypothetical protein
MSKNNLPTYAIVELLIRLAKHNESIGDYKGHAVYDDDVIVKTSGGSIVFSQTLIVKQFESPELISEDELARTANLFKSSN